MSLSEKLEHRLRVQGYTCDAEKLDATADILRIPSAFCMVGVLIGTLLASPLILSLLIPIAFVGIFLPHTPFGYIYNWFIAPRKNMPELPANGKPRKFACLVAVVWLSATAGAFYFNYALAGYILGFAMVIVAGLMTFMHFCIASVMWRWVFGWNEEEQG